MKKRGLLLALGLSFLLFAAPLGATVPLLGWNRFHRVHHFPHFHNFHRVHFHGWWGWGWGPGWSYPPYYGPYDGSYYRPYAYYPSAEWAAIDTDVSPEEARVYLDGRYIGIADDFDGWPDHLYLKRGHYRLEFRLEGYEPLAVDVDARPGMKLDIKDKLRKIAGAKHYGSYDTPKPEGGVRRYWAKRKDVTVSVTDEQEISGYPSGREERGEDAESGSAYGEKRSEGSREQWREKENRDAPSADVKKETMARPGKPRLRLRVEPVDAAVYVDDRFVGTAEEVNSLERGVSVSPGKHTVTVSRPGFKEKSVEVEVGEGASEKLEVSLSR